MASPVFTIGSRTIVAHLLMQQPLFLAVGSGDPAWDDIPPPATPEEEALEMAALSKETSLKNCVGFTRIRSKSFVTPDEAGTIVMLDGSKWSKTNDPVPAFMLEYLLDLEDATGVSLRENGIYVGTQFAASVPAGQMYVPLADVTSLGTLIQLTRFPPIVRDGSLSQSMTPILEV